MAVNAVRDAAALRRLVETAMSLACRIERRKVDDQGVGLFRVPPVLYVVQCDLKLTCADHPITFMYQIHTTERGCMHQIAV
eukprot:scaffold1477_cov188-Alexandrium_tamarense.AAC.40